MEIFIMGASGFIGGAIAKALSSQHHVYGTSRSERSDNELRALNVISVRCELGEVKPEHLAGCEVVIHCAAFVKPWGTHEEFWKTNVGGTAQLLHGARQAGVKRFIHGGPEAVLFHGQHMHDIDETYPYPDSNRLRIFDSPAEDTGYSKAQYIHSQSACSGIRMDS